MIIKNKCYVYRFIIKPTAKERATVVRSSKGRSYAFTPTKTKNYESIIRTMALMQHGKLLLECPIHIEFEFNFKRGKTVKRKYHTVKPDLSNCIKSIEDAFNGVVYKDDCQIKKLTASKNYSNFEHVVVNVIPVLDGED